MSRARWRWISLSLLGLTLATCRDGSDEYWPSDNSHFFSTDMRPVHVTLHDWLNYPDSNSVTFDVPRAWITRADGYKPTKLEQVPNRIRTSTLDLWLSEPDGAALSIRSTAYAKAEHTGWSTALARLRPETYFVSLYAHPAKSPEDWSRRLGVRTLVQKDGLPYDPNEGTYILTASGIRLAEIHCTSPPHRIYYCNYTFLNRSGLLMTMTFVDFRAYGGTDYAISRIHRAQDVLCRQSKPLCPEQR